MAVSREQLYRQVWAKPMLDVADRYDVSSSFLARVCRRMSVPRPPRGYWAKRYAGKKIPERPELPAAGPGDELVWLRPSEHAPARDSLPRAPDSRDTQSGKRRTSPKVHPLVAGAERYFEKYRLTRNGYLKPTKLLMLDVVVSKAAVENALRAANSIYRALERRGHSVTIAPPDGDFRRTRLANLVAAERSSDAWASSEWVPYRPTVVYVGTVPIGLTLFETTEATEVSHDWDLRGYIRASELPVEKRLSRWNTTCQRFMPCGKLCLRAYSADPRADWLQEYRESRRRALAGMANTIVADLEAEAPKIAQLIEQGQRENERRRREWEEEQEGRRRAEEERCRLANIKAAREGLQAAIAAWGEATRMEAFFHDVERRAAELDEQDRKHVLERVRVARELLGPVDALQRFQGWRAPDES